MKILHTADWHIGQFKGPVVDGVNLRSQDTVKCLEYMVQVAIEEKPDIVCVSGDIFHQEQVGPVRYSDEMITATNIITSLAHFSKYVIVMRGTPNHDGAAQFRVLERMLLNIRNVDVVTEPGVIKTPWADIACLPGFDKQEFRAKFPGLSADEENLAWTKYISDMVFALRAECEKTPILMAHYTVPGCNMESGQTSFFTNFEPVIPMDRNRGQFICCFTKQAQPDFKGILMDSTMILFDAKHTDKDKIGRDVVTAEQQACFERYQPVVKALNAATVEKAAGTGNENLNVLKNIYQNLGTFIEKSEEQEEMEVEITKAELETIVAGAVQKAMGASQNAANPPQNAEGAAITTNDVQKDAGGCEGTEEPITAEAIEKMVNAAIQKAVNPPEEPMTMAKAQEFIEAAVAKALDPIIKSAGLPSNLNNADCSVQKSAPESHFMDGVFF